MHSEPRERIPEAVSPRAPRLEYRTGPNAPFPDNALAVIRFATPPQADNGPHLTINVGLTALDTPVPDAVWCGAGPIASGQHGKIRFAHDGESLFGVIEEREGDHPDIRAATVAAYEAIGEFRRSSGFPHLLRMWNFVDAVNEGEGDLERYRQFCIGRAEGFGPSMRAAYPAATGIGRQARSGLVQVFWIAAKTPGVAIENPRQVSAYRYPRTHGPVSPSFSRATVLADGTLLVSGTASIVGHISQHPHNVAAQLDETLRNLEALIAHTRQRQSPVTADAEMRFTVYVREPNHAELISSRMREAFPDAPAIVVAADICRRELLLEIECVLQSASNRVHAKDA